MGVDVTIAHARQDWAVWACFELNKADVDKVHP